MSIKQLCFDTHTQFRGQHQLTVRRTHIYELLAALLGFNSHAALAADAVIGQLQQAKKFNSDDLARLSKRSLALGYLPDESQRIVEVITAMAEDHRLCTIDVRHLVNQLASDSDHWAANDEERPNDDAGKDLASPWLENPEPDFDSPLLIDALEQLAAKNHADAHYALALLLQCEAPEDRDGHWYRQQLEGLPLDGPEKEWADEYAALVQFDKYRQHLAAAARLGRSDAALAWAELTGEEPDFRHAQALAAPEDATRLLDLADQLGASATVIPLLRQAALSGDVEAMRRLAEDFEPDPVEAWTWIHLAELCGTDLTKMEAAYEDSSPADDDIPGNIFAVGGVDVPGITSEQHARSRLEAARRYDAIRAAER